MIDYKIQVVGLKYGNRAHQELYANLQQASNRYDALVLEYPHHTVVLTELVEKCLKSSNRKPRPTPDCPYKHGRQTVDERPCIVPTAIEGQFMCRICSSIMNT